MTLAFRDFIPSTTSPYPKYRHSSKAALGRRPPFRHSTYPTGLLNSATCTYLPSTQSIPLLAVMALNHAEELHIHSPPDHQVQNHPTSTPESLSDEVMADIDDGPNRLRAALYAMESTSLPAHEFGKKTCALERKHSLLTRILHISDSDSNQE